jgi:hypothetical protein
LDPVGGDVGSKIHQLLSDSVWNGGRFLDVGSGQLLIRFVMSALGEYVEVGYWGEDWEYSRS